MYKLQDNDFYTTATVCGYLGAEYIQEHYDFIMHRPRIRIPTPRNSTFFDPQLNSFFKIPTAQTPSLRDDFIHEINAYKMYVPFSPSSGSNTIYNTLLTLFAYWRFDSVIVPRGRNFTFTYKGLTRTYDDLDNITKFNIYKIGVSGVLPTYKGHSKTEVAFENPELLAASRAIYDFYSNPDGEKYYTVYLYICVPNTLLYVTLMSEEHNDDPLMVYMRDAVRAVYLDSILTLVDLYGEDISLKDLMTDTIPMSTLYPTIRAAVGDDEPLLVINNLCRGYNPVDRDHIVNSNENANWRSYMPGVRHTVRARRMEQSMRNFLISNSKLRFGRYRSFTRLQNKDTQRDIMKKIVKHYKIRHDLYKSDPSFYVNLFAFLTKSTQILWRKFLEELPEEEFYVPGAV